VSEQPPPEQRPAPEPEPPAEPGCANVILDSIDFRDDGTQRIFTTRDPFAIELLQRGAAAQVEARDAYRPARDFYGPGRPVADPWALRRLLKAHPQVRTRRPRRNRLEVHAGDWAHYVGLAAPPAAVDDATVTAYLDEIDKRRAREHARKARPGGGD
jgi:hypothetical protein